MSGIKIGVVGATGQVGAVVRQLLEERKFPVAEIRYFASARSAGTTLPWKDQQIVVTGVTTLVSEVLSTLAQAQRQSKLPGQLGE